jgi:hypothetical protein
MGTLSCPSVTIAGTLVKTILFFRSLVGIDICIVVDLEMGMWLILL